MKDTGRFRFTTLARFATFDPYPDGFISILHSKMPDALPVVNVEPIVRALRVVSQQLIGAHLPSNAPPCFLLDSDRGDWTFAPEPGWFDNRSVVTPADFPSTECFRERGIFRIVLVQAKNQIQRDLRLVLAKWQREGMSLFRQSPDGPWAPRPFRVSRPFGVLEIVRRLRVKFGYRRNRAGAFGGIVPPHASGG